MRFDRFSGTHAEIGLQRGEAFRDRLNDLVQDRGYESWPADRLQRLDSWIASIEAALADAFPEFVEELHGNAEGAGLRYEDVLRLNFEGEAQWLVEGVDLLGRPAQCSQIALRDEDGRAMLGKSEDAGRAHGAYVITELRPHQRHAVLHLSWPQGFVDSTGGINEVGLAVSQSSGNVVEHAGGIPRCTLLRLVLERYATVAEASEFLQTQDGCLKGMNFLLADATGDMAVVEHAPSRRAIRRPTENAIYATNHFADRQMFEVEWRCVGPEDDLENRLAYEANTRQRYGRLSDFARQHAGQPGLRESMEHVLGSHGPGGICQHGIMDTTWAMIADPRGRRLWLADGPPCRSSFELYELDAHPQPA